MAAPQHHRLRNAAAVALLLASCSFVRSTQSIDVAMTEGPWSVEPTVVEDVNQFDFTFRNDGAEAHSPIVVVLAGDGPVEPGSLVNHVIGSADGGPGPQLIFPAGESGRIGHFHPGGPEEPNLPEVAVTIEEDEGELIRYLFTDMVGPGDSVSGSVTAGEPEFTFGMRNPGTRYVGFCMDPAHAGMGEHVVFDLAR